MHPNELGAKPDEIEAVRIIERTEDGKRCKFIVYRFRTRPPHWAARKGWLAGIAGPTGTVKSPQFLANAAPTSVGCAPSVAPLGLDLSPPPSLPRAGPTLFAAPNVGVHRYSLA